MRNFWYLSFLAVMYLFLSWAAEAFAEPINNAAGPQTPLEGRGPLLSFLGGESRRRAKRESESDAALDSFSLSYTGNYILSETIKQVRWVGSTNLFSL